MQQLLPPAAPLVRHSATHQLNTIPEVGSIVHSARVRCGEKAQQGARDTACGRPMDSRILSGGFLNGNLNLNVSNQ